MGFPWRSPETPLPQWRRADQWRESMETLFRRILETVGIEDAAARDIAASFCGAYLDPGSWRLFDDTEECLEELSRRGHVHRILSNHVPELPQIVGRLGIAGRFEAVTTSALIGWEKPRPEAYRTALEGVKDLSQVVMVGDSYTSDVAGAMGAGRGRRPAGMLRCFPAR